MHHRHPIVLALALLAACAVNPGPGPAAPIAAAPPATEPAAPATEPSKEPASRGAPVQVAEAAPAAESWPGATEPTPGTPPGTRPTTPPPVSDTPAAVTVAVASVQLMQDCPDDRPVAAGQQSSEVDMSHSQGKRRAPPSGCSLNLSLTNAGGRAGQLRVTRVRLLDGKGKRTLATVTSRTPTRWDADTYVAWDERVAGNTTTQVAYSLADAKWERGGAGDLYIKPYIVEVVVVIDGRKQTVRSAEFVPASPDMIQT